MDTIGLITLEAEVREDVRSAVMAAEQAAARLDTAGACGVESCAFQLARLFNIVEQMGLRIAKAFENHIDDSRGWHAELIHRLSIKVPGIRPSFYPPQVLPALRDLRGFRHIIVHAYDLDLDEERLSIVLRHAGILASALPGIVEEFFHAVRIQETTEKKMEEP